MLGPLGHFLDRRRERRAERQRDEQAFLAECEALVAHYAGTLVEAGLARAEVDASGGEAPPSIAIVPTAAGAAAVWIGFDYPTFQVTFPHPSSDEGYTLTAELFGSFADRLAEVEQRLDAIVAGRLEWSYRPDPCSLRSTWTGSDGAPFLETSYVGPSQGPNDVGGRAAPYAAA